ncbi:MAG: hypothetical protein ABWW69_07275 [Pyrodictiaceae archaeon]
MTEKMMLGGSRSLALVDDMYHGMTRGLASRKIASHKGALACTILQQLEKIANHTTYIAREALRIHL